MNKSGLVCVYCVYHVQLLRFIELYLVVCFRVSFVISFVSTGFPYKDQIEELFIVMVYCMYSQHVTLSTYSLISLF